ncbi:AGAP004983-PA [Anopheles gambiae str. PEST]|uniref:AGAP004983-PA n=1 Tax=Anopheles gambiae TaxID=7165 RepID=A7UTH9_ANOGA|nr:AGAP004983-PA [Anopheles gambiae str. PEST]
MILQHLGHSLRTKAWPILCLSKRPSSITSPTIQRTLSTSSVLFRKAVIKREEYFLKKDNIPAGFSIVYRAPMENYLTTCNIVTSFSFLAIGGICAFTYLKDFHHIVVPFEIEYATLTANETDLLYFLGFFFLINAVIRVMVNRYPLRIYRNDKQYIAVFEGQIPLVTKQFSFQQGEVTPVPPGGVLPWQESRYKINDKKVLLLEDYFRTPSELNAMMMTEKLNSE